MTVRDRVLSHLAQHPEGVDDDVLAAALGLRQRQQANQVCRQLESEGLVRRERVGRKIRNFLRSGAPPCVDPVTLELVALNEGVTASVTVTLTNTSPKTIGRVEVRAPVPPGMDLVDSSPVAEEYGEEVGWTIAGLPPEETVASRYRLNTRGLAAEAQAAATVDSVTYTSAVFPIGSPATPPRIGPVPNVAQVPLAPWRVSRRPRAIGRPWHRAAVALGVGALLLVASRWARHRKAPSNTRS